MGFEDSDAVADEGVAAVNRLFSRDLKWIFREVPKRDVGVDAQVEVCRDRIVTSRLLALQIKAGNPISNEFRERRLDLSRGPRPLKMLLATRCRTHGPVRSEERRGLGGSTFPTRPLTNGQRLGAIRTTGSATGGTGHNSSEEKAKSNFYSTTATTRALCDPPVASKPPDHAL